MNAYKRQINERVSYLMGRVRTRIDEDKINIFSKYQIMIARYKVLSVFVCCSKQLALTVFIRGSNCFNEFARC
jgi:hypothetical protein